MVSTVPALLGERRAVSQIIPHRCLQAGKWYKGKAPDATSGRGPGRGSAMLVGLLYG
jgi:hypothetical protein